MQNKSFLEQLDQVWVISRPARETLGEDSFYGAAEAESAVVSVCDGCGGLGARKYEVFQGHTGAYMASRTVSGAVRDWYQENHSRNWKDAEELAGQLDTCIRQVYGVCESYVTERLKIRGSMVRKFPTTLALACARQEQQQIVVHILWAGDSRVYLSDQNGLAQLTVDDTDVRDALENLQSDGAMTNVLSSDGKYQIHTAAIRLTEPAMIFAATDGCFGYIPSPMEFEYMILDTLHDSRTPAMFRQKLKKRFAEYAGDDFAFGFMSFGYGSYADTVKQLEGRREYLKTAYIDPLKQEKEEDMDAMMQRLWKQYKPVYERYLERQQNKGNEDE